MIYLNVAFEDVLSEFIISRLLESFNNKFSICNSYNGRGFGYLKTSINGFNQASATIPFLVLTDLDQNSCPVNLVNDWLDGERHPNLIFRVAAWILGDSIGFSRFSRTPLKEIPNNPEQVADPKRTIINLVSRYGTKSLKEDIVPVGTASIGRSYNIRLMEFVLYHWDINRAMKNCESLRRMMSRLETFQVS